MARNRPGRYGDKILKYKHDGHTFDSKRELARYGELQLLQKGNAIRFLEVHPKFKIIIAGVPIKYITKRGDRQMTYTADFKYEERQADGSYKTVIEDVKMQSGYRTEVYKIKRALMKAMGNEIREV